MRELAGDTGFPCGRSEVLLKLFVAAQYLNVFKKKNPTELYTSKGQSVCLRGKSCLGKSISKAQAWGWETEKGGGSCWVVAAGLWVQKPTLFCSRGAQQENWPEGTVQDWRWGGASVHHLKVDQKQIPSCPVTSEVGEMWSGSLWASGRVHALKAAAAD